MIEDSAYQIAREIDAKQRIIVGVNQYVAAAEDEYQPHRIDPAVEARQVKRLAEIRSARDAAAVEAALSSLKTAAAGDQNLLYPIEQAVLADATVGEICDVLRGVWGELIPAESI